MALLSRLFKSPPASTCLSCGKNIDDRKGITKFECNVCGLKGDMHDACLFAKMPASGGGILVSTGTLCPECAKKAAVPVDGISEETIDKIVTAVNHFDHADRSGNSQELEESKRALHAIGTMLDEQGGMKLMQLAYKRSIAKGALGPKAALLNYSWDGIGQWSW